MLAGGQKDNKRQEADKEKVKEVGESGEERGCTQSVAGCEHERVYFDWCCFYYFVRNSLVALLKALCARILFLRLVNIEFSDKEEVFEPSAWEKSPSPWKKGEKGHGWTSGKNAIVGSAGREERRRVRAPGRAKQGEKGKGEGKEEWCHRSHLPVGGHLKPNELIPKNWSATSSSGRAPPSETSSPSRCER